MNGVDVLLGPPVVDEDADAEGYRNATLSPSSLLPFSRSRDDFSFGADGIFTSVSCCSSGSKKCCPLVDVEAMDPPLPLSLRSTGAEGAPLTSARDDGLNEKREEDVVGG